MIKRKNRTLLTDKSTRPARPSERNLDKIPEKTFKKSTPGESEDSIKNKLKSMNLSEDELKFLKEYRRLEDLEREKGIKFFECVGDPPATVEFLQAIEVKRQNFIENKLENMRNEDCHRFATEINRDKVVVPVDLKIDSQPKWDVFENNHFAMRKRLVSIFLKVANKLITRQRAGKRLKKIKHRLMDEKVYSREDCKRMVAEDWKTAQNMRFDDEEGEDTGINAVKFKFQFNKS